MIIKFFFFFIPVQNMLVPISKNNGNDQDYIYLDALNGDDAEKFLSFEKKYIINNSRNKLLQELDNLPKGRYFSLLFMFFC